MAHLPVNKNYNTFVKGLVTEASPLSFPENASVDEENFELNRKGYRARRLGLDYENNFNLLEIFESIDTSTCAIGTYMWENAANNADLSILVIQVGSRLVFLDASGDPISEGSITPATLRYNTFGPEDQIYQFTTINGDLIVANHEGEIIRYVYESDTSTIYRVIHGLLVRDLWGVKDNRGLDERIPQSDYEIRTDYNEIKYNLANQGWLRSSESTYIKSGGSTYRYAEAISFLTYLLTFWDFIPSRRDAPATGDDASDQNGFNTNLVARAKLNTNPAPIGHHIIDLFYRGRSRMMAAYYAHLFELGDPATTILENFDFSTDGWDNTSGIRNFGSYALLPLYQDVLDYVTLSQDATPPAIRCVATYAGRVFYGGFNREVQDGYSTSPFLNSYVFYSQLVSGQDKIGKCYQDGDPTSVSDFDLVDTDGGFINIIEAANIIKLVPFLDSLLVFATNGVWEIKGSEGGFSATSNQVRKITSIGAMGQDSIVVASQGVLYFSEAGIGLISVDNVTNALVYLNISETSIQSLYNDLPTQSKKYAKATYIVEENKVSWIYNDSAEYDGITNRFNYNKQLTLDLTLGAFYKYSFGVNSEDAETPFVASLFQLPNFVSIVYDSEVFVNTDEVVAGGNEVVVGVREPYPAQSKIAYLCIKPYEESDWVATIGALNNASFADWASDESGPIDAPAFIETGLETLQEASLMKQVKYINVFMERTENGFDENFEPTGQSSCLMSAKWDFADHSNSGKITNPVQVYRYRRDYTPAVITDEFNYGQSVITSKNKLRGRGRSLSLRFDTEEGKNCILYGWGVEYGINSNRD